ncbi:MAG TPA: serine/threonine-protein kinase, partial [Polyangiales bacterium]|nr:serine/threonine-protein kinase [Polyangiales bacterium]
MFARGMSALQQTSLASSTRYEVVRELGVGASGRVMLVRDRASGGASRALKIVRADVEERVRCEFSLLAQIEHPNLCRVHELVRVDELGLSTRGALALVSDYAEGVACDRAAASLALSKEKLLAFALRVLDRTARALSVIHAHGFVHGDVKPDNVIATPDATSLHLIDLGLARAPGFSSEPSGTPRYMAPELWRGEVSSAADVFALGLLVRELLVPARDEFAIESSATDALARALALRPALPSWVPAPLDRLLARMIEPDRTLRFASGRDVIDALRELAPLLDRPLAREFAGPAAEARSTVECAIAVSALPWCGNEAAPIALAAALRESNLVAVVGPRGAGRSRLVRDVVFALQRDRAVTNEAVPSYRVVTQLPHVIDGHVLLHVLEADAIALSEVRALLLAAEVSGVECRVVLERSSPLMAADVPAVAVEPLDASAIERLLRHALPGQPIKSALVREALAASGGLAARLCRLLAASLVAGEDPAQPTVLRSHAAISGKDALAIPPALRPLVELLAVAGGALAYAAARALLSESTLSRAAHEACSLGLSSRASDGKLELRPELQREVLSQLTAARRNELARALRTVQLEPRARAFTAWARGEHDACAREFGHAAEAALSAGAPARAAAMIAEAASLIELPSSLQLIRVDALRALGRYEEAAALAEQIDGASARLLRAELARLAGDRDRAAEIARDLVEDRTVASQAHALLARLAFDRGDREASLVHASSVIDGEDNAAARAAEVIALVELSQGRLDAARAAIDAALGSVRRRSARTAEARLLSVVGAIDRAAGDLRAAARSFSRAYELAEAQGEYHAAASFLVNVGTAQLDAGELGPAQKTLRDGARRLARLGRASDLARALSNLVLAAQLSGDFDRALWLATLAERTATSADDACALAFARLSAAEISVERGDLVDARERLRALPDLRSLAPLDRAIALARSASLHVALSDTTRAEQQLMAAEALLPDAAPADVECALAATALARKRGDRVAESEHAERALAAARRRGEFAVHVLALLAAGAAADSAGDGIAARARFAELRSLLDAAALTLTAAERALLRRVKAYQLALAALPTAIEPRLELDRRFRQLAQLVKRLNGETRLPRLYSAIVQGALELSGAERAVLLRRNG